MPIVEQSMLLGLLPLSIPITAGCMLRMHLQPYWGSPGLGDYALSKIVGIALLLSASKKSSTVGSINISVVSEKVDITQCFNDSLEALRVGNPIGLGLPLIESLVKGMEAEIVIPYLNQNQVLVKVNNV
jgi:hypothetical protein